MKAFDNNEPLDQFIATIGKAQRQLQRLEAFVEDHMGYIPEDICWKHVSAANHFLVKLIELANFTYKQSHSAEERSEEVKTERITEGMVFAVFMEENGMVVNVGEISALNYDAAVAFMVSEGYDRNDFLLIQSDQTR